VTVLLARGFRPFFLLGGLYGCCLLLYWLAILAGLLAAPARVGPNWWHAHEMVFGFVTAAIAGFLLTSVPVWSGTRPVVGWRLAALVGIWLAGRVAIALAGILPAFWVALVDLAFLPCLATAVAVPLVRARQARNYGFILALGALALANLLSHLEAAGVAQLGGALGSRLAVLFVALLVVVIGGRIVPAFTRNALRRAGRPGEVRSTPWLDRLAAPAVLVVALCEIVAPRSLVGGGAALVAAALLVGRMARWQTLRALYDPLLWSLHLGYIWVALGLACLAASDLLGVLPWTSGLHALTAGAFGTMILAVMSRVALGHTGRELAAPPGMPIAYLLVSLGALLRVAGPVAFPQYPLAAVAAAGLLWASAFAIFSAVYIPILCRPRVDGAPG
jgi:uncharacterized protein involved in response to NO